MADAYDLHLLLDDFPIPTTALDTARFREIDLECVYCGECCHETDPDTHVLLTDCRRILHYACHVRLTAGSIGHQTGRCPCFGGDEEDPPGISIRQAALIAWGYWGKVTRGLAQS
jgi:hypothetical protein